MTDTESAALRALSARWRAAAQELAEKAERLDMLREPERSVRLRTRSDELQSCAAELDALLVPQDPSKGEVVGGRAVPGAGT